MIGGVFASSGYTFSSLIENQGLVGDDKAVSGFLGALLAGFLAGIIVNLLKRRFHGFRNQWTELNPYLSIPF